MKIFNKALEYGAILPALCQPTRKSVKEPYFRYGRKTFNHFEYTPSHALCIPAEAVNEAIMKLLLERGSDPNMRDSQNLSVLSIAVVHGNLRQVEFLLAAGANQFRSRGTKNHPMQIAAYLGNKDIFYLLLYHDPQGLRAASDLWGCLESALRGKITTSYLRYLNSK
jgi:hypothetical protein